MTGLGGPPPYPLLLFVAMDKQGSFKSRGVHLQQLLRWNEWLIRKHGVAGGVSVRTCLMASTTPGADIAERSLKILSRRKSLAQNGSPTS